MRYFRTFLFVLLSFALPLQGYAHFVVPKVPCPMEPMAMMDMADADAMHDCCNDADTAAKTGKPCKLAQYCQSVGQFLPIEEWVALPLGTISSVRFPRHADTVTSFDPAATWRPPTQR